MSLLSNFFCGLNEFLNLMESSSPFAILSGLMGLSGIGALLAFTYAFGTSNFACVDPLETKKKPITHLL